MQRNALTRTLETIESRLQTGITAEELARDAGYSAWHFRRMFSAEMGVPLAAYILSRRLKSALYEIARGYKAIDVVLAHGFDTYAGFYKAFVREYGCSPRKYVALYGVPERSRRAEVKAMGISRGQIRELLKAWEIDPGLEIGDVLYMNGTRVADDVWRVGEDYYLLRKAHREKQLKDIAIAKALSAQRLESALPVLTKSGGEYLDGETLTVLTRRVKGVPYELMDPFGNKASEYADACGRAIARLHQALRAVEEAVEVDEVDLYETVRAWALPDVKKQNEQWSMGLSEGFFEEYLESFGCLQAALPRQVIHRDPNPGNILLNGDAVAGFIDFELSERNVRLFDPCYCATGVLSTAQTAEQYAKWPDVARDILRGYDAQCPLTPEEKRSVFWVMCSITMICVAYFNAIDEPDFKRLTRTSRKILRFIRENRRVLENIF